MLFGPGIDEGFEVSALIIGHRGMGATPHDGKSYGHKLPPENTILSFARALEAGVDGIEMDVHLSADGVPVVIHSKDLRKKVPRELNMKCAKGCVKSFMAAALRDHHLGYGQTIPTLEQVIVMAARYGPSVGRKRMPIINIELKAPQAAEAVCNVVTRLVSDGFIRNEDVVICSFNWAALHRVTQLTRGIKVAPMLKSADIFGRHNVTMPGYKVKPDAECEGAIFVKLANCSKKFAFEAVDCVVQDVRPALVDFCRKNGLGLYASVSSAKPEMGPFVQRLRELEDMTSCLHFSAFKVDRPDKVLHSRRKFAHA